MSEKTVLLIDIGNTSITLGLKKGKRIVNITRVPTQGDPDISRTEAIRKVTRDKRVESSVLCSVVPSMNRSWKSEIKRFSSETPLIVDHTLNMGISIDYPDPESIGADRLANACGAAFLYGKPVIVADFGTALTFDIVSSGNAYLGGIITPGLPLMTDYLYEKTALLPHIKLKGHCGPVGRSTAGAMRIGAKVGYRGIVRETVKHLVKELKLRNVKLCATGGYAEWALSDLDMPFIFNQNLTLQGLAEIYRLNTSSR